jgi:hypothetical protein
VDVVHPEFNPTFAETVAKSRSYLLNNYVAASAALDAVMTWIGNAVDSKNAAYALRQIIEGKDRNGALHVSTAVRGAWIGRACMDGSSETSSDFVYFMTLTDDVAAIDEYVALPVLQALLSDIENNFKS